MSKQPVSEQYNDQILRYLDGEMTPKERTAFEDHCKKSATFNRQYIETREVMKTLSQWKTVESPNWIPNRVSKGKTKHRWNQWLSLGLATAAFVLSILPYLHITADGLLIGDNKKHLTISEFKNKMNNIVWDQNEMMENKIEQVRVEQNTNNRTLVMTLVKHFETQRKQDLAQMVSWMSQEKELNSKQQRQIIQWVQNEQYQDSSQLKALWTQVANSNHEVYPK